MENKQDYAKAINAEAERRMLMGDVSIETREEGDEKVHTISGYAAKFNSPTQIGSRSWGFIETYAPGCFDEVIATDDVRCLFNHNPDNVLGRSKEGVGTLSLSTDQVGLRFECEVAGDIQLAQDIARMIKRGDVSQCSCAFVVSESTWKFSEPDSEEMDERTINKVSKLYDVGPVTYPAYADTEVAARSLAAAKKEHNPSNEQTGFRSRQMAALKATIHQHT